MGNKAKLTENAKFVTCSICDHIHPIEFDGDCRDDSNRFTYDELEAVYGSSYYDRVTEYDDQDGEDDCTKCGADGDA